MPKPIAAIDILTLFKNAHKAGITSDEYLVLLACSLAHETRSVHIADIMKAARMDREQAQDLIQSLKNKGYAHHENFSYHLTSLGAAKLRDIEL